MKRFLVVSDPPAAPGYLPRVRFLCEYLVRKGCDVTLLTEEYQPLPFPHSYPIETIKMYSGGIFDWLVKTVWTLLTDWHNRAFAKKALSKLKSQNTNYDLVICSAFSDFPLGAAQRIAKSLQVPLLCDIRDLDEQVEDSRYQYHHQTWWTMPFRRLYRAIHISRRNEVLEAADFVTTVSPWHAAFIRRFNRHVDVIFNGYDNKQFYPKNIRTDRFTISYIGSLFDWQQPALEKVKRVVESINRQQPDNPIMLDIHTPGCSPVPYNRLGSAIRKSSIMLVLTSPDTHGMLTTKFYEALGCEKPILCVPSDRGALAELMAFTKAGIATDDEQEMARFLLDKYQEWQKNGFTRQKVQHKEHFARDAQYDQYYSAHI